MDTYDEFDKKFIIRKYGIYALLIILILIVLLIIFLPKHNNYGAIEKEAIAAAKKYITQQNIVVYDEYYIELPDLEQLKGTDFCSKASGVIVKNNNGQLTYQAFFKCSDYTSEIPKISSEYLELNGSSIMILNNGEKYQEPGYFNKTGAKIEVISNVKEVPGIYNVYYKVYVNSVLKETITRKVIVSKYNKDETISGLVNKEYPTLTLNGDVKMVIGLGENFEDPGYSAIDYKDGRITRQVKVTGTVNNKIVGSYFITYEVTNSKGNKAVAVRQIDVVQRKADLIITSKSLTNDNKSSATISLKVTGEGYSYIILPDGNRFTSSLVTYEAKENQKYVFKIYDIYGNETVREINIDDLDKNKPTGSCVATITTKKADIVVTASDDNKINSYTYFVDGKEIKTQSTNTLEQSGSYSKDNIPVIKVQVEDVAGNSKTLTCTNTLKLTPNTYIDINGYNCLEPFVCYKQLDYSDPYRATSNGTGTIYNAGCQPTSMTIISTKFNKRSKNGNLYTPSTLVNEIIYPDGKIRGYSNWPRIQEVAAALNLKISKYDFKTENLEILKDNLRDGNPALLLVSSGCYTGSAHYMAILGINEEGKVFLSDPFRRGNTSYKETCTVNTWVDLNEIKSKGSPQMFVIFSE